MTDKKVVIVTGASGGVGKELAGLLADKGYTVYGTSRGAGEFETVRQSAGTLIMTWLDVNDPQSVEDFVKEVDRREGRIDALVNNAGNGIAGALETMTDKECRYQLETNFFGALCVTRQVCAIMRRQGFGRIVATSSLAAQVPLPFQSMYSASKAALEAALMALGMEMRAYGITVCCVELGDTETGFTEHRVFSQASGKDVYAQRMDISVGRMEEDERNGMPAAQAAAYIAKKLAAKNPQPIALCGMGAKLVYAIRKLLPLRLSNLLIGKLYG